MNLIWVKQQGFEIERIEDGIMHQELKDSLICGICLGNISKFLLNQAQNLATFYKTSPYLFQ